MRSTAGKYLNITTLAFDSDIIYQNDMRNSHPSVIHASFIVKDASNACSPAFFENKTGTRGRTVPIFSTNAVEQVKGTWLRQHSVTNSLPAATHDRVLLSMNKPYWRQHICLFHHGIYIQARIWLRIDQSWQPSLLQYTP